MRASTFGLLTRLIALCVLVLCAPSVCIAPALAASMGRAVIADNRPSAAIADATKLGPVEASEAVPVTLTLPLRNQAALTDLLRRLSDPRDPQYGHYLTPEEFTARFGPTQDEYDSVEKFARDSGLTVTHRHANRLLLDATGPASRVEAAFAVHLARYKSRSGRVFRAPDTTPSVPHALAGVVAGVVGLNNSAVRRTHALRLSPHLARAVGTGPQGGLSPTDVKNIYGLSGTTLTGAGQTIAVYEMDGFDPTDVAQYQSYFGLGNVPVTPIPIDGFNEQPGANSDEVTLDIELALSLVPGASQVLVYESPNTDSGTLDAYSQMAEDNTAQVLSTSWGLDEPDTTASVLQAENNSFQQMAAQGQTFFAAAGDDGAYDTGSRADGPTVDDPASQPYVCGVGGTTLRVAQPGGPYVNESTWNTGSVAGGAGGGGISSVWPIPSWQKPAITQASGASATMRNVPDISLDSDPNTGYSVYINGTWQVYGGTSGASPTWASFAALVNQQRAANGLSTLGQITPALYALANTSSYATDFHDIADGSGNLYYTAVAGYDDATGLGSFIGSNLLADLSKASWIASGVAVGADNATRLLWTQSNGSMSYWTIAPSGAVAFSPVYGPYSGWSPFGIGVGGDNRARIVWTAAGGAVSWWTMNQNGPPSFSPTYGPYAGWTLQGFSVGRDNSLRLLWVGSSGAMSYWTVSASGAIAYSPTYGPFPGWTPVSIGAAPSGVNQVLWTSTAGAISLWTISQSGTVTYSPTYGPFSGWTAVSVASGADSRPHLLWRSSSGASSTWTIAPSGAYTSSPVYGPYAPWSGIGFAIGPDNATRLLWTTPARAASYWTIGAGGNIAISPTYGPY